MKRKRSVTVDPSSTGYRSRIGRTRARNRAQWSVGKPLRIILTLLTTVMLTACGDDAPADSTTTTLDPDQTSEVAVTASTTEQVNDRATDGAGEGTPAALTLGALVDQINEQWSGLVAFREVGVSRISPPAGSLATPVAATPVGERSQRTVREVILPDRVRYVAELNGQFEYELIVIGDRVFARGAVASLLDPTAAPDEWIETDVATVAGTPLLGETAAQQLTGLSAPRYSVPERLRPQPVRRLDPVTVDGTECEAYGAADTTASGARIDITFAVDAEGRLCFIETEAIGITSRYTVSALDESFSIRAPAGARPLATPIATPAAGATPVSPATPEATP